VLKSMYRNTKVIRRYSEPFKIIILSLEQKKTQLYKMGFL
ncbi:MAG: hypothetical protein ACI9JT_002293, partial [Polaribacter sp.]